jgi:hypothetical protein
VHVGSQRLRRALLSYSKGSDKGDSAMTAWIYGYLSYLNSTQDSTREIQKVWRMQSGFFFSSEIADTDLSWEIAHANIRFFEIMANVRRKKNFIHSLQVEAGVVTS